MAYPSIYLPGSEQYWSGYEFGEKLYELFPDQGCHDFSSAISCNELGPLREHGVGRLLMVEEGEKDERDWIWLVMLDDYSHWWLCGGCDYTGWDCISHAEWTRWDEASWATDLSDEEVLEYGQKSSLMTERLLGEIVATTE